MLGHNTLVKPLHFRGHKGPIKKAYVHWASKGSNPLDILFYVMVHHTVVNALKGTINLKALHPGQ
jgi:hypothetical protein